MAKEKFVDPEFEKENASDDEIEEAQHGKLLQAIHLLDSKQRIKPPSRTEPCLTVSEFDLAPVKGHVTMKSLVNSLQARGKAYDGKIAQKVDSLNKTSGPLQKPLEKPQEEKIHRSVGYKNVKEHVSRWNAIVQTNRTARSVSFPMNIDPLHVRNKSDIVDMWKSQPKTPFEAGLLALQEKSKVYEEDKKEEERFKLTLQELREKRKEIAKLRAQQSYEAAKARRQKKIKSKSYHRILRKEKMHGQLKDFEALQKTDPEAALKQLEQLEKVRAQERMTLRHKSTGHWARSRLIRAKYDPKTRQELAEQLAKSRDLTKKLKTANNSDEDDDNDVEVNQSVAKKFEGDEDNPWITKTTSEIEEFISGYKKYWEERNKEDAVVKGKSGGGGGEGEGHDDCDLKQSNVTVECNMCSEDETEPIEDLCEKSDVHDVFIDSSHNGNQSVTNLSNEISPPSSNCVTSINKDFCVKKDEKLYISPKVPEDFQEKEKDPDSRKERSTVGKLKKKEEKKNILSRPNLKVRSSCSSWEVTPIKTKKKLNENVEMNGTSKVISPENGSNEITVHNHQITTSIPESFEKNHTKKKKLKNKTQYDKMLNTVGNNISFQVEKNVNKQKQDHSTIIDRQVNLDDCGSKNDNLEKPLVLRNNKKLPIQEEEPIKGKEVAVDNQLLKAFLTTSLPENSEKNPTKKNKRKNKTEFDKMFDRVESNISTKIQEKIKKLKYDLSSRNTREVKLDASDNEDDDLGESLALKNAKELRPVLDEELIEGNEDSIQDTDVPMLVREAAMDLNISDERQEDTNAKDKKTAKKVGKVSAKSSCDPMETNINPNDFVAAKPKVLLSAAPEIISMGEEALDDVMAEDQQQIITEAFADDNVLDDFRKEKEDEINANQPEDIDLSLPGWGEWGGTNIKPSKRKSRFIVKAPPQPPRKDDKKPLCYIREETNGIRKLQVDELPMPYRSVKDFEASIRAPVGRTWIPETAHRKIIKPAVITKIGTIIKPMDEEFLVNKKILAEFTD